MFNGIFVVRNTEVVFDLVDPILILNFTNRTCKHFLAISQNSKKSRKIIPLRLQLIVVSLRIQNLLVTQQEKRIRYFFPVNIAHLTRGVALKTLIINSSRRLKVFFCLLIFSRHISFAHYTIAISSKKFFCHTDFQV